jgi:hypothetical protein
MSREEFLKTERNEMGPYPTNYDRQKLLVRMWRRVRFFYVVPQGLIASLAKWARRGAPPYIVETEIITGEKRRILMGRMGVVHHFWRMAFSLYDMKIDRLISLEDCIQELRKT